LYAATIACISAGDTWKPALVAHTLLPSLLKIAALSRLPVPTRLLGECQFVDGEDSEGNVFVEMYLVSTYAVQILVLASD
jgi:hypothetical protein